MEEQKTWNSKQYEIKKHKLGLHSINVSSFIEMMKLYLAFSLAITNESFIFSYE